MNINEMHQYISEVLGEQTADAVCNCFDSTYVKELVEYLKSERGE